MFAAMRVWLVGLVLLGAIAPSTALAKCRTGNPPSYDDISAIMLKRDQGYWTAYKGYRAKTFDDSAFWAIFWNLAPEIPNAYSQYDLDYQIGYYKLRATLADAIAVLRRDKFFALSPADILVLDTAQEVLSVKRCRVITRIQIYDWEGEDASTVRLFRDLEALIQNSYKVRISPRPKDFEEVLLFDP